MRKFYFIIMLFFAIALRASAQSPNITELTQKAEAGNAQAQYELAVCYQHGNGVQADDSKAMSWYIKAAKNKQPDAAIIYGTSLLQSAPQYNIAQNIGEGVKYLYIAAEQGKEQAITALAGAYFGEKMLHKDLHGMSNYLTYQQVEKIVTLGAKNGSESCQNFLAILPKIKSIMGEKDALITKYGQKAYNSICQGNVYVGMPEGIIKEYKTLEDDGSRYQLYNYKASYRDKLGTYKIYIPNTAFQYANIVGKAFPRSIKVRNGKVVNVSY